MFPSDSPTPRGVERKREWPSSRTERLGLVRLGLVNLPSWLANDAPSANVRTDDVKWRANVKSRDRRVDRREYRGLQERR